MRKKISPKLFKNKKRVWIIGGIGFLVLLVLGFNLFAGGGKDDKASESPTASKVTKGQLASSTLLTGMVKAQSEQYVYFDNTIGRNATVTVSVGEEVSVGQQLVQYDSTSAQAAYDTASVPIIRQFVTVIISNSMEQLLQLRHKQVVIRMRMIRRLPLALNSVSKPRQVITKPCKIIMMLLLTQHQS